MEALLVLFGLSLIVAALGVPWLALVRARRALERCAALESQIHLLRLELRQRSTGPETQADVPTPAAEEARVPEPSSSSRPSGEGRPVAPPVVAEVAREIVAPPQSEIVPPPLPPPRPMPSPAMTPRPVAPNPVKAPERLPASLPAINWEHFMGAKLFLWLGGLGLFLAVAFGVKYSFDRDLISPELRVAIGFLIGLGLLVGGILIKRKAYRLMSHTLSATGVVSLYAVTFSCRAIYHFPFFDVLPTFCLMTLITATAFVLAVRMDAMVVAILGILGGFITPVILNTGQDNPLGLFGYVALLDAGLIAVVLNRRWYFLTLLAAACTGLMQVGWVATHFSAPKIYIALGVFVGCNALFLAGKALAVRRGQIEQWSSMAVGGLSMLTVGFNFYLISSGTLTSEPGVLFAFALGADLCLLALVLLDTRAAWLQLVGGGAVFGLLALWTSFHLGPDLLNWALGMYFVFGLLHSLFPLLLQRLRPGASPIWWANLFPLLALVLVMVPLTTLSTVSWVLWPVVLIIDALAVGLAVLSASLAAILVALLLSLASAALWLMKFPSGTGSIDGFLMMVAVFGLFFFGVCVALARGWLPKPIPVDPGGRSPFDISGVPFLAKHLTSLSVAFPFLLLILATARMSIPNPSPVFGLGLLFALLLLGVARALVADAVVLVTLGCVVLMEYAWHSRNLDPAGNAVVPLLWYLGFALLFAGYAFLFRERFDRRSLAWVASALSWPAHFLLVYPLVKQAYPNPFMGLLPLLFSLPALGSLAMRLGQLGSDHPERNRQIAWFGGVALLFLTLVFPIQFSRQWLTVGWALEGVALLWLFHRVTHLGLRRVGVALLAVAFVRLAFNPAVFEYHVRGTLPLLNWYLYTYGLVILCLFCGARLYRALPLSRLPFSPVVALNTLAVILAFYLLNLEIADYFTEPGRSSLVFEFSGNFARDMSYSLGWALFALVLLGVGMIRRLKPARLAALGLLGVTLAKLFFHDLKRLDSIYRIAALAGVAVVAITASFLYQKFFAQAEEDSAAKPSTTMPDDQAMS